ncbi:MAG: hypothetical protein JXA78_13995 [Anaerolineales bacterium]|nr:hypothetical protein [Anaerolineales bacterium]
MDSKLSPPVSNFLPAALILIILGWGGLYAIVMYTTPSGGTRWAFFFAGVLALTGVALPVVAFLNRRFPSVPPATSGVILRQAIWIGIYLPTLAWLRIGRVLTPSMALLLAVGLFLIEWLLRLRERSQWKPESDSQAMVGKARRVAKTSPERDKGTH